MAIASTLITSTPTAIFTCPAGQEFALTTMFFCNYSGSDVVLQSLNLVRFSESAIVNNRIVHNLTIPAGETFTFDSEKIILSSGDFVSAVVDADTRLNVTFCTLRVS